MEAYIDDMVVKSRQVKEHLTDLGKVFSVLRGHRLLLNVSKCSFGVSLGKFPGYMITHRGIKVNPNQIKAISSLHPPWNPKVDRCRPFFQLLHKWKDFHWTEKCVVAFEELKQYLSNPPILSRPEKEEVLYAYLAVTDYAVSLVLVRN